MLLCPKQPLSVDFAVVLASNDDLNAVSEDSCFPEKIKILEETQITSRLFFLASVAQKITFKDTVVSLSPKILYNHITLFK